MIERQRMRRPILFADGEQHRTQRAAVARFFTPRTVDDRYRTLMQSQADELIADMLAAGAADFSAVALRYSVAVAAQVIGLTDSDLGQMATRLEAMFSPDLFDPEQPDRLLRRVRRMVRGNAPVMRFFLADVKPAIRARRERMDGEAADVITHLLQQGYSETEILTECVTYAAAGMVTTREFLQVSLWHLLTDAELRARYLSDAETDRRAVLSELLRLEPVVGHLYRRARGELVLTHDDQQFRIAAGDRLNLYIRDSNADPTALGPDAETLCPGRSTPDGVRAEVMSFGDGPHRCPGNAIALQESDVLLRSLLAHEVHLISGPQVGWDDITQGYELRRFMISVAARDRLPEAVAVRLGRG